MKAQKLSSVTKDSGATFLLPLQITRPGPLPLSLSPSPSLSLRLSLTHALMQHIWASCPAAYRSSLPRAVGTGVAGTAIYHISSKYQRSNTQATPSGSYFHAWSAIMAIRPEDVGELPVEPFQPRHIAFPSRSFGKSDHVKRLFQANWFNKFPWLHYDLARDAVRCFMCCKAVKDGRAVATGVTEQTYLVKGFTTSCYTEASKSLVFAESSVNCAISCSTRVCSARRQR